MGSKQLLPFHLPLDCEGGTALMQAPQVDQGALVHGNELLVLGMQG